MSQLATLGSYLWGFFRGGGDVAPLQLLLSLLLAPSPFGSLLVVVVCCHTPCYYSIQGMISEDPSPPHSCLPCWRNVGDTQSRLVSLTLYLTVEVGKGLVIACTFRSLPHESQGTILQHGSMVFLGQNAATILGYKQTKRACLLSIAWQIL